MKFKVEIEVPDFPSAPMPVETSRISQLLGEIGSCAIEYAMNHHNDKRPITEPITSKVVGHYWVEDGMTEEITKPEPTTCSASDKAIGEFFKEKKGKL